MNNKKIQKLLQIKPIHADRSMLRSENFGAILVAGDNPLLSLNEDALKIWKLCDGTKSVNEIKLFLHKEYEDDQIENKLLIFIDFCLSEKILLDCSIK